MTTSLTKVVDAVTYGTGTSQYVLLPASHKAVKGRAIYLKKNSGSGTLDVHPIEFSLDGVNYFTAWSNDGAALNTPNAEATNQSAYAFNLTNNFPYARLKLDVNSDTVNISVVLCEIR